MSPVPRGPRCRPPRRPGNVLVLFAVLLTSLVGMVAFAIDTGYIALTKTNLQRAADAAAHAGALAAPAPPGEPQDVAAVRAEVRKYVALNAPGLTARDEDVRLCRYTPYYDPAGRFSYTYSVDQPANAVEVTLRRDRVQNSPLKLFFAPVIGARTASLSARAVAYLRKARSVKAGAPVLPYVVQYDYYYAAMGQTRTGTDGKKIDVADQATVNPATLAVSPGPDGVNEVMLFGDKPNAPGNFGSIDLGSSENSTAELERQVLYGPSEADFANPDFVFKVSPDGSLYVPFSADGDSGLSATVKTAFESIRGKPRIVPLYDTKSGTGDGAVYHVIGYAGVVLTRVDFTGNPKKIWVQPAFVASNSVAPMTSDADAVVEGVYLPPKMIIP